MSPVYLLAFGQIILEWLNFQALICKHGPRNRHTHLSPFLCRDDEEPFDWCMRNAMLFSCVTFPGVNFSISYPVTDSDNGDVFGFETANAPRFLYCTLKNSIHFMKWKFYTFSFNLISYTLKHIKIIIFWINIQFC